MQNRRNREEQQEYLNNQFLSHRVGFRCFSILAREYMKKWSPHNGGLGESIADAGLYEIVSYFSTCTAQNNISDDAEKVTALRQNTHWYGAGNDLGVKC